MTRYFLITSLLSFAASAAHSAEPPTKRGGLFGFGAPKTEQISAGLFPAGNESPLRSAQYANTPAPGPRIENENIFRRGNPQPVAPVAYVIENGRKIEKPIETVSAPVAAPIAAPPAETAMQLTSSDEKKKGGFFAFGRKNEPENEIVTPVPPSSIATPVVSTPAQVAAPVATVAAPIANAAPVMTGSPQSEVPRFEGVPVAREEKSGWHPFSHKKSDKVESVERVEAAVPVAEPSTPTTPPVLASTETTGTTTYEVPRSTSKKEDSKKSEKPDRDGGLLSPIANIRVPRKEVDLSNAETIIQNGEIVNGSSSTYDSTPMRGDSGPRRAPQIVDGVKTYSSWGDVNARSTSAADKILNSIR